MSDLFIASVGAFDRFNYGDVLFPRLLEDALRRRQATWPTGGVEIAHYALIEADLTSQGGVPCRPLSRLRQDLARYPRSAVVLSGGALLCSRIGDLHADYIESPLALFGYRAFRRIFGYRGLERRLARRYGLPSPFPHAPQPEELTPQTRVAFNAVGGSDLDKFLPEHRAFVRRSVELSAFASVRDRKSLSHLDLPKVQLSPDSAHSLAALWPRKVSTGPRYLSFQVGSKSARRIDPTRIAQALRRVAESQDLEIHAIPIGQVASHGDREVLASLLPTLGPRARIRDENDLGGVAAVIAGSAAFFGTSLHGNITAMTYGVPFANLDPDLVKLQDYLATWAPSFADAQAPRLSAATDQGDRFRKVLATPATELARLSEDLATRVEKNFDDLFRAIF